VLAKRPLSLQPEEVAKEYQENIGDFYVKPIIAYSIDAAIRTKILDRIIVSTGDDEIATISCDFGAEHQSTVPQKGYRKRLANVFQKQTEKPGRILSLSLKIWLKHN
jgi:hypothetical protein